MLRILFMIFAFRAAEANMSCETAKVKCVFRDGCSSALQNYMLGCSHAFHGNTAPTHCPETCQLALIALTSTEVGKELMNCDCEDDLCKRVKRNIEVCKPHVLKATRSESIVTCDVARFICEADSTCSTALNYYYRNCKLMFEGKKCSHRCKNSIDILKRQTNAAKLETCICNGKEEYDCPMIKNNMETLCFNKKPILPSEEEKPPNGDDNNMEPNEIVPSSAISTSSFTNISTLILSSSICLLYSCNLFRNLRICLLGF